MAARNCPKYCIVEGDDTSAALLGLIRQKLPHWVDAASADVWVRPDGEICRSLKPPEINVEYKVQGRTHLAYVIDAEDDFVGKWAKIQSFMAGRFANIPVDMPDDGLILLGENGKKFGVWIMPDNKANGMLEDFLRIIVPTESSPLWEHAVASVALARADFGAPCIDAHLPKAHIHTWLGFQDPPGQRFGTAIMKKVLDPNHSLATTFIDWFRRMFEV